MKANKESLNLILKIRPSKISGSIQAPPSKSMLHRLLISAGLSEGSSVVRGASLSEDILASIDCLRAMGAEVECSAESGITDIYVSGIDPARAEPKEMRCRESGSTLRFMIPVAALSGREVLFSGSERLLQRPLSVYEDALKEKGVSIEKSRGSVKVIGRLRGGEYEIDGGISSQFISGLLFALPLAKESSILKIIPPVSSRPYIDMSIDALSKFGIEAGWQGSETIAIAGSQKYRAADVTAEGDWSNAAFLIAMGADVSGLDPGSLQGDRVCIDYFRKIEEGTPTLDISACPDLGPVLMAYAALHSGCILTGTDRLAIKESDRGRAMKEELSKFGTGVCIGDDYIEVGGGASAPEEALQSHNDHRIVMALSVLATRLGGVIEGAEAINKSFPDFVSAARECGADMEICD